MHFVRYRFRCPLAVALFSSLLPPQLPPGLLMSLCLPAFLLPNSVPPAEHAADGGVRLLHQRLHWHRPAGSTGGHAVEVLCWVLAAAAGGPGRSCIGVHLDLMLHACMLQLAGIECQGTAMPCRGLACRSAVPS